MTKEKHIKLDILFKSLFADRNLTYFLYEFSYTSFSLFKITN